MAVSKFHPVERLMQAYDAGQRAFGENRAQELVGKVGMMPGDVSWHFIGKLQKNKVRMVVRHVSLIQSIDSEALLRLVDAEAARAGRVVDVLLELHVAREETKSGFSADEMLALQDCEGVSIEGCGLFGCGVCGVNAGGCTGLEVVETEIYECSGPAVSLYQCDGVSFTACSVHDCQSGIRTYDCGAVQISD